MKASPSKLSQAVTADAEFDAILDMSQEEFLIKTPEPIPANRIALLRKIEEENGELRRRKRLRTFGYRTVLVLGILVAMSLMAILIWMCWLAASHPGGNGAARKKLMAMSLKNPDFSSPRTSSDVDIKNQTFARNHIVHVPRKLGIHNKRIDHASSH